MQVSVLRILHGLADQLDADAAAPVGRDHEDVAEPRHVRPVRHDAAERDQRVAVVRGDHARRLPHESLDRLSRAAADPVRLLGQEPVDGVDVHARAIVVELQPVRELASHQQVSPSRRCWSAGNT